MNINIFDVLGDFISKKIQDRKATKKALRYRKLSFICLMLNISSAEEYNYMKLLMLNIDPMTNNKLSVNERGILSVLPLFLNALKIKKAYLNEWIFRDDRQTYPDEDSSRVISWLADMLVCLTQNIKTLSEETHITVLAHDDDILDMKYISPELHAWLSSTYMGQILVYQLSLREQFQNIK